MNINEFAISYHSIPFGICVIDANGYICFVNQSFKELLSGRCNNVVKKHVTGIFPIFEQSYFQLRLKQVFEQKMPLFFSSGLHGTILAHCFSKEATYFEVSIAPLALPGNSDIYAVITIEEVTEMVKQIKHQKKLLKTLNVQLEKGEAARKKMNDAQKELRVANSAKDKLFSVIGHDLKTPFMALSGISELLMKTPIGEDNIVELKRLYEAIWMASMQGTELVTNLLNWAQTQSKSIKPFPIRFNIVKLIQELESFFKLNLQKKSISVKLIANTDINSVFADMDMTKVVIQNLLSNAIKFSHKGSRIEIELQSATKYRTKVIIRDFGKGMSHNLINRIQGDDSIIASIGTDMERGTGIGLSICCDFLRVNNSKLGIKSTPDVGSEFSFSLPVAKCAFSYTTNTKEVSLS